MRTIHELLAGEALFELVRRLEGGPCVTCCAGKKAFVHGESRLPERVGNISRTFHEFARPRNSAEGLTDA